jgi:hypothetical protein
MRAVGDAAEKVATAIGTKSVEAERIALDRDKVISAAESHRHLVSAIALCVVLVALLVFAAYALNKAEAGATLAADVVKFGIGALLGGFGGWGLRASAEQNRE